MLYVREDIPTKVLSIIFALKAFLWKVGFSTARLYIIFKVLDFKREKKNKVSKKKLQKATKNIARENVHFLIILWI